ncbi:MAG: CRISPR-associated endonuclease Cas2 [Spirulinaceae cyanobacterium SM2_1_0]|nr:CRISPR-associated endonuclease Cas2 [Spirulinaceae cyanobacterium SM2_1_0]
MLFYLVIYDIPCDRRRRKVAALLEGYGRRVQYSAFECVLVAAKYRELLERLQRRLDLAADNVRIYPLSGHTLGQVVVWGGVPLTEPPGSTVV